MSPDDFTIRRATIEDLASLRGMWVTALLPALELEKRLTEFQIVEGQDGRLIGAIGIKIVGTEAQIHSETFTHPETEAAVRPEIWKRLRSMADNHGIHRFWTVERSAFWPEQGFKPTSQVQIKKLPPAFGNSGGPWSVLVLRDETAERRIEQEFSLLDAAQNESEAKLQRQTRFIKIGAGVIAGIFILILIVLMFKTLLNLPGVNQ